MIRTIVFSRDRAAQLDLLLRSLALNAPTLLADCHVLWDAKRNTFFDGYDVAKTEWPDVVWHGQNKLRLDSDLIRTLRSTPDGHHVVFLTDDSVVYRPLPYSDPETVLDEDEHILTFSLRLGRNTTRCYPHNRDQALPVFGDEGDYIAWAWRMADGDFGYPGSLDGHIFRKEDLVWCLHQTHGRDPARYWCTPNQVEDALMQKIVLSSRELMASYPESVLVGVPVNRSNEETHTTNRFGVTHARDLLALNEAYLAGGRLSLDSVRADEVDGAHAEFALELA